jgi:hypothetical protein
MPGTDRAVGDPNIAVVGAPQVVAVGASPFSYVNQSGRVEMLYVTVPTGVTFTVARGGITIASILTPAATTIPVSVLAPAGSTTVLTYNAGAPTMTRDVV